MSTSDSDYSIDWLTSDDDAGSPKRSSPKCAEGSPSPVTSSLNDSPTSCFCWGVTRRRTDHKDGSRCKVNADSAVTPLTPAAGPVCVCPYIYTQQTLSTRCPNRKRKRSAGPCEEPQASSEDEFFSQKCLELQCYIQPLSSILQGLRSGRYSERLSSFQESVAMDRIQRIMGVLQNPNMGGRFVNILLKIEEMLHSWFPHVEKADDGVPAQKKKRHHSAASHMASSPVSSYSFTHLKWLHTSPVRSLKTPSSPPSPASSLPPGCTQEVTQDNAVSSTTDLYSVPLRHWRGPSSFKISSPCLQRLLQAKESIIAPRTMGGGVRL